MFSIIINCGKHIFPAEKWMLVLMKMEMILKPSIILQGPLPQSHFSLLLISVLGLQYGRYSV